jgi:hypothetical protein
MANNARLRRERERLTLRPHTKVSINTIVQ